MPASCAPGQRHFSTAGWCFSACCKSSERVPSRAGGLRGRPLPQAPPKSEARALTFTTLIFSNLGLIYTNRSWSRTIPALLHAQ